MKQKRKFYVSARCQRIVEGNGVHLMNFIRKFFNFVNFTCHSIIGIKMANSDKYRRVKLIGPMLIAIKKDSQIAPYENNRYVVLVMIMSFLDLLKNAYLGYLPMSSGRHLLYGDVILSLREDQRLYNYSLLVGYGTTIVHFYLMIYGKQRSHFFEISKFLYVLPPREYSRKFLVTREFAERFSKWLDRGVIAELLVRYSYLIFTASFYAKCLYKLITLGYSYQQILTYSIPSILIGAFGFRHFYFVAVPPIWLFVLYIQLMKGRWNRLTAELDRLTDRPNQRRKLARYLNDLDKVVSEYKMSKEYFQVAMISPMPVCLVTIALFPTNIVFSENLFTNQLILMFMVNCFGVLFPVVKSNEIFKRGLALYLDAVHRFMNRNKDLVVKLKMMKILDTWQKTSHISYTVLDGWFDLEIEYMPIILCEVFSITFLIYPFLYYSQYGS